MPPDAMPHRDQSPVRITVLFRDRSRIDAAMTVGTRSADSASPVGQVLRKGFRRNRTDGARGFGRVLRVGSGPTATTVPLLGGIEGERTPRAEGHRRRSIGSEYRMCESYRGIPKLLDDVSCAVARGLEASGRSRARVQRVPARRRTPSSGESLTEKELASLGARLRRGSNDDDGGSSETQPQRRTTRIVSLGRTQPAAKRGGTSTRYRTPSFLKHTAAGLNGPVGCSRALTDNHLRSTKI